MRFGCADKLSVEAAQVKSICVPLIGVALKAVGVDGAIVSGLTPILMAVFVLPNAFVTVIV